MSMKRPKMPTPALFTQTSIGPSSASICAAAASSWALSATSAMAMEAVPPSVITSFRVASRVSSFLPISPTRHHLRANRAAALRPMPDDAPVMTTTRWFTQILRGKVVPPTPPRTDLSGVAHHNAAWA